MTIRKMGLNFAPSNRNTKINNNYSIDEVSVFLTRYLNDEFELTNDLYGQTNLNRLNKAKISFEGLDEIQALMLSVEIIGIRILRKYCKGEKPHWMRMQIWKKGLQIVDSFEERELLDKRELRYYYRDGHLFSCRVYTVEGLGEIILPDGKPKPYVISILDVISTNQGTLPTSYAPLPPIRNNTGGKLKKEAARIIMEYQFVNLMIPESISQPECEEGACNNASS